MKLTNLVGRATHTVKRVCISVSHTCDSLLNGSIYRNTFAPYDRAMSLGSWGKYNKFEFKGFTRTNALSRGKPSVDSKNFEAICRQQKFDQMQ